MALRVIGLSCGLLLAAGLSFGEARAAGRGGGVAPAAPRPTAAASLSRPRVATFRGGSHWRATAGHDFRQRARRRWDWAGSGYADPWPFFPQAADGPVAVIEPPDEPGRPLDLDSFENLPARAGIRREATPEPTLYRLEGPRLRPEARVIRIGASGAQGSRQARFAHAETGALLLTVPGR